MIEQYGVRDLCRILAARLLSAYGCSGDADDVEAALDRRWPAKHSDLDASISGLSAHMRFIAEYALAVSVPVGAKAENYSATR